MGGEKTRPMWWQTLPTMLVLATIGSASDGALCPARCRCNDETLSASCGSAALEVVPIQLNPEVRHIDLSSNKITHVHFTFNFYDNLITLDLSSNKIKTLGSTNFESQRNLKHLNLSRNEIEKIFKDSLKGLRAVTTLDLSYNRLEELNWETFRELHSLQILKLSENRLVYLEEGLFKLDRQELLQRIDTRAFVDNINLEKVWLDDNIAVDRLPTRLFHGNPRVTYLSVRNNRLTNIEVTHFPLDQLRVLKLAGNPLQCNCSLSWLWHLIQEQKLKRLGEITNVTADDDGSGDLVVDLEDIRCAGPEPLTDVLLVDATESQVDCSGSWIAAVSATLTALFIVVIVGGLLYWGPIRRARAKEKELSAVESRCRNKTSGACSNGRSEPFENIRTDKCMIAPPLIHHDYRTLPSWDPYSADCASTMNIYEHLDLNNKTRPHIVYV
ncbi:LRR 8 domain containing protein [Asbolus verrucosus]|uniref:LRR 8 domain containing protein n=1 Tax=Asbolus verrucosus TaxID=1661398 RepID=A0A482W0V8_ASBVE|nr:LRR 8 domain containing protein [Asbolus verrucosus]